MVGKGLMLALGAGLTVLGVIIGYAFYDAANTDNWDALVVLLVPFLFVIAVVAVSLLILKEAGINIKGD